MAAVRKRTFGLALLGGLVVLLAARGPVHAGEAARRPDRSRRQPQAVCADDRPAPRVQTSYISAKDGTELDVLVYLPCEFDRGNRYDAIVISRGLGSWQSQRSRWEPFAEHMARNGFVAVYPDTRQGNYEYGATDLLSVILALRESNRIRIDEIGMIGASLGNKDGLHLIESRPNTVQAYVNLYGVVDERPPWLHLDPDRVGAIECPILTQVGSEDEKRLMDAATLELAIQAYNPGLWRREIVYPGSDHGFLFRESDPQSEVARADQLQFFRWALGEPAPE